ncbi:putative uncharacterized protein DDB_G0282133 isoform X3 [Parasteatoda tepidariorum]|uniref:putative uncharacterized protein DDB_G0282133 isoform X3 n=1 Tax=Parasteatoda tepidariorum TaxID=114398 RepID=UPI001C72431F|nr:putative uncharacterized protein DDB_G0282133 isoform X3 [Parasteatoda tepidariorum]
MVKHSRIKLMRRKKKLFPWLRTFYSKYKEKFFKAENTDIFEYLFLKVEKEIEDIYLETNEERREVNEKKSEDFFNILNSLFLHFWWQIRWKSCKKWETYWKKVKTTKVSTNDSNRKCCIQLLHYMILLSIFLTGGDEQSDWIGRILTAIKSLPDAVDILCSALLLTSDLKKKHISVYSIILKHTLCCETVKNTAESETYCKVILLFRRLLKLTECEKEKSQILRFTSKLKVPSDIQNWLSSQNIEDSKNLDYDQNLTRELLSRSYPDELLRKLSEILSEDSFCKRKSLKVANIDAYNVPSNVTSKENLNTELDKDTESFDKTNSQNGLNGIRIPSEKNINHCSESLQNVSENQKLEKKESVRDSHKKKEAKISKESSKKNKKHKRKSKEKPDITALKLNDGVETCSKLIASALDIDEYPSNVTANENISGNLNCELNKGLLELDKTNFQNGLVAVKTTTSCITAENPSNDVKSSMIDQNINKEVLNAIQAMSGETNVSHCSESLQKTSNSKKQKLGKEESVKDRHKKKKAKVSKESSKKKKKHKKKSKEKPDITALKINHEFETHSKASVPALDIDECSTNVSGNLNSVLDEGLLDSLDKASLRNSVETTTSFTTVENLSNDANKRIKHLNEEVLNPFERMSGETKSPKSVKQTSKKQKLENEASKRSKNKKEEKDKVSKMHKKNQNISKEKLDENPVTVIERLESNSKLGVDINVSSNVSLEENISKDLNDELDVDLLESVVQNDLNDINNMTKDLHNTVLNPMDGKCNEINVVCCSESLEKASKKRKLENKKSERLSHKKKKKEKRLKESVKEHKKNKRKSKAKTDETTLKKEEDTYSKLNMPASNNDVPFKSSLKRNVSEDLLEALLESNASNTQNDFNGIKTTTSCIATERTFYDIDGLDIDKDLYDLLSNSMEGIFDKSLGKASKKQKSKNEESERRNHKKKKKDKILKQSSENCKENKKKTEKKPDKNKEFEPPCNSQKPKKSKKAEKTVAEISKSSKEYDCNLNSERNRSKSTSNIEELHDFESTLDQEKVFHEQPDCNIKTKRRRSKSESQKKEQNHSKKSKKLSRDKKITKHNGITEFDTTDTILPVKNFSESKNVLRQIKNQSQSKKVEKHFSKKLQMPNECLNIPGVDNSNTILSVNNFSNPENIQHDNSIIESYGKKTKEKDKLKDISEEKKSSVSENNYNELFLMKENTVNKPKKSPKVKRKKLFKDSHYLNNSHKEIQCSTTITNNCTVPTELSPSKRHSFLDDDASGNIDMSSINSNIDSNFSSSEETTTFSDVSEILNFPVDIYRHNVALGLSPKTKSKKMPNSNINEQNKEFSLLNNDLLMASKKILQQSTSEPVKSQSCIDNESDAKGTEKDDNQNAGTLSFCSTNISESGVDSDFVGGNKVPKKCASTAVLTSKQNNEVKSASIFQQSQFTNNTEDTFLSMNCSFRQDFEANINIHKSSSERSFSSFSHSSLNPSVMLNDVLPSKSAQKYISTPEKSFTSISESDREMQYCTPPGTDTNLEMSVSHELTSENIAKANELYKETKGAVTDLFRTDKQCNSPCMQNVSTISLVNSNHNTESCDFQSPSTNSMVSEIHQELNEFQSPSLIQVARSNVSSNEPERLATSVSLSQFNVSVTKSQTDDCGTNTENVNCKSVSTATETNYFQSPSLIHFANCNVSSNEPELLNTSVSVSQFNDSFTKNQTDDCGMNTENVNCKSVSTATEIINSNNSVNSYNNDINSNDISNQVCSIQVTVNFTGNDDCSASRKQQFVAQFGFQTVNNFERTPLVSSVSFTPANASTPMINNNLNPNLDSIRNHDPLHIFQFNQTTNSTEKSVNCYKCCDTNTSHEPEKIRQCVALNDSDLNRTLFSNSSPTIVNKSKNINHQSHPKLFSNFASLYGENEALSHSSIYKHGSLLFQNKCLKPLTNENLDSPIGESNELPLKAKDICDINNESSYRTSTILDESGDDCSHISSSSYSDIQTVGSMDVQTGTLKVGTLSENECLLSQDGDFIPLTTKNLDSLSRGAKSMNNDSSLRSSTIYSSDSSLSTLSNYSYNKREVSVEETSKIKPSSKRKRNNKIPKSCKRIETDSDSSMPKLEPIIIDKSKSCSEEVSSLSEKSSNEGDTLEKNVSPVNNRRNKSRNSSKKDNSLSKSPSDEGDDPKKNLSPVNNPPLTPQRSERRPRRTVIVPQESSSQQKIITQNEVAPLTPQRGKGNARKTEIVPQETSSQQEIISQNKGYNLRAKKSLLVTLD